MLLMLPIMLPDMTLYSVVAMALRQNGAPRGEQISQTLFGSPWAGLRHDFPSHIVTFCQKTGNAFGDPIQVAMTATVLPYFLRFRPPELHAKAMALMFGDSVEPLKFVLGLPAGPSGASMPLRYCQECAEEDLRTYGVPYWHRQHQLPGVLICPHHLTALRQTLLRLDGRGRSGLFLPDDYEIQQSAKPVTPGKAKPLLGRLARLSAATLNQELLADYSISSLQAAYAHGLKQQGLLTSAGNVRATEFVDRLEKHYRAIADVAPFSRIISKAAVEGMLRLVRKPRVHFHTACHLLLVDFLFGDWDLFTSVYRWEQQMELPFDAPCNSNLDRQLVERAPDANLEQCLTELAKRWRNGEGSLTSLAKTLEIDINTAMRWLGKLNLMEVPRRPKTLTLEVRAGIIESLKSGNPIHEIVRTSSISRSSIDRICNEEPNLHVLWQQANRDWKRQYERRKLEATVKQEPTISLTKLRQTHNSGYRWLSRHDRDWLKQNLPRGHPVRAARILPAKPRVDWSARDRECLTALRELEPTLQLESWERLKPQALLRRLPPLSFSPRLDRLPKSSAKIAALLAEKIRFAPLC